MYLYSVISFGLFFALLIFSQNYSDLQDSQKEFRVFITNSSFATNFSGLSGADAICTSQASYANLSGIWKAWISDSQISASQRLYHSKKPYVLMNGEIVAKNWKDLIHKKENERYLSNPININQFGEKVPTSNVMTSTLPSGEKLSSDKHLSCFDWTSCCSGNATWCHAGFGTSDLVDPDWTATEDEVCTDEYRLYCFEQPASFQTIQTSYSH